MIAVGVLLLGTTSTAAIEMSQLLPFVLPPAKASGGDNDIPRDFRLEAEYYPGGNLMSPNRRRPWEVTITSDGKVSQKIYGIPRPRGEQKKLPTLSKSDLRDLLSKIEESSFFKLKEQYLHGTAHHHTGGLRLRVSLNGRTHEANVIKGWLGDPNDPAEDIEHPDIKMFMFLWDEVLKKVPPPESPPKPK
jgi:hypothetical protein